ncbi:lysophospholipase [Candidatus Dependentiae bacterium]|nr:lysophospholipase [Candidatus Dependentiae bacterium]
MNTLFINNRQQQSIAVLVEHPMRQRGVAVVMHGLGGRKEQAHLQCIAETLREQGYTVVRFDTTNATGASGGDYYHATASNYYHDLEDLIAWAATQSWYQEPFILVGHSLGGLCTALFAENNPAKVYALAPIATVVSGSLLIQAWQQKDPQRFALWQQQGWQEEVSRSRAGLVKRLAWAFVDDVAQYDLLPLASSLTMPVLLLVGEADDITPLATQQLLYEQLSGCKELHLIAHAPHTIQDPIQLQKVALLLQQWLRRIA